VRVFSSIVLLRAHIGETVDDDVDDDDDEI
jgi:hypothetical protein